MFFYGSIDIDVDLFLLTLHLIFKLFAHLEPQFEIYLKMFKLPSGFSRNDYLKGYFQE